MAIWHDTDQQRIDHRTIGRQRKDQAVIPIVAAVNQQTARVCHRLAAAYDRSSYAF